MVVGNFTSLGGVAVHFAIIAISLLVHAIAIIVRSMINKK